MFKTSVLTAAIAALSFAGASSAAVVEVTGITGHDGGNWPSWHGHLTDMVNGLNPSAIATGDAVTTGMDSSVDADDPSTWTWSGNYQQTWHANSVLSGAANDKIGWVVLDFGSVIDDLDKLYMWASSTGQTDGGKEQVKAYNLYYSSGVGIDALPAMPTSQSTTGDYDFTSGDWASVGSNTLGTVDGAVSNTNSLGGISAQYIGIEVMSIYGVDTRMAIAQVEVTTIPEPGSLALLGLGGLLIARRRRA